MPGNNLVLSIRRSISAGVAAIILLGCKKTIHPDLDNAAAHIVIQGEVTDDGSGPDTVRVNRTVSFYAGNSFPAVSGASIKISDNEGNTDSLLETAPGIYITQGLKGKPGNTYTLSVLSNDTLYTAVSTMPQPVNFDSVTFNHKTGLSTDAIFAVPKFQDPAGIPNYYQFMEYLNHRVLLNKNIFVFDDRLSDGRYITVSLRNSDSYLHNGDYLEVRMYCIDQPVYNYFNELDQSSGGDDDNASASPSNPVSNISNGALGYFSAHTVRVVDVIVH